MNNRGFAITGILYTLFIMFLLILVSVLSGLSSRRNILQKSLLSLEESFSGTALTPDNDKIEKANESHIAPIDGKYEFEIILETGEKLNNCVSYLKEGTGFSINAETSKSAITFVPKDCNQYRINTMKVTKIISFESE